MDTSSVQRSLTAAPCAIVGCMLVPVNRVTSSRPVRFHRAAAATSSSLLRVWAGSVTLHESAHRNDLLVGEACLLADVIRNGVGGQCSSGDDLQCCVSLRHGTRNFERHARTAFLREPLHPVVSVSHVLDFICELGIEQFDEV